ncbi:hypothetical protein KW801_01720 [Candidatus Saccharibacteria bacterium]|nr:hypothetical protein [Candidatus Saccharibacteria bacterium]
MDCKVNYHARKLVRVWEHHRIASYTIGTSLFPDETVLFRPLTIEDAPEAYMVLASGKSLDDHDFGPTPLMLDAAAVRIARRIIGEEGTDYEDELIDRERECSQLLKAREEVQEEHHPADLALV